LLLVFAVIDPHTAAYNRGPISWHKEAKLCVGITVSLYHTGTVSHTVWIAHHSTTDHCLSSAL